jgi:DNA invertase Pin-like site-specific DNA recombinase
MSDKQTLAYSYIRFSDPSQAKGDSLRRQTEAAAAWCKKHGLRLDAATTLRDLGKSAYTGEHRRNPDRHALAAFLKLVEQGRVPRGSYLIIENLDRLSREDERAALRLWMDILDQGVNIVQLQPETVFRHEKSDMFDIMRAVMELARGHGESKRKSERVGAAWGEKKRRARDGELQKATDRMNGKEHFMSRMLPAWVREEGGKLVLVPERAAVVRRVYHLAARGHGVNVIAGKLSDPKSADFAPAWGRSGRWNNSYLTLLLSGRNVLGELETRDGKGEPLKGYYPPCVTEAEWLAAREAVDGRFVPRGRPAVYVNVFAGLLWDARSGEAYAAATEESRDGTRRRVLVNRDGREGRGVRRSFPFDTFEHEVLGRLREVNPGEVMNLDKPDETLVLAGRLAGVESSIAALVADLEEHGDSPALFARLRQKEALKKELAEKLAAAKREAMHPLSESWGETHSLIDAIDRARDPADARLRLKAVLRRVVEDIRLLVVPRGRDRLAIVQVWFREDGHRSYSIYYRPGKANASSRTPAPPPEVMDFKAADGLDLRNRKDAADLERALVAAVE